MISVSKIICGNMEGVVAGARSKRRRMVEQALRLVSRDVAKNWEIGGEAEYRAPKNDERQRALSAERNTMAKSGQAPSFRAERQRISAGECEVPKRPRAKEYEGKSWSSTDDHRASE
jgi:hypothetical protein